MTFGRLRDFHDTSGRRVRKQGTRYYFCDGAAQRTASLSILQGMDPHCKNKDTNTAAESDAPIVTGTSRRLSNCNREMVEKMDQLNHSAANYSQAPHSLQSPKLFGYSRIRRFNQYQSDASSSCSLNDGKGRLGPYATIGPPSWSGRKL